MLGSRLRLRRLLPRPLIRPQRPHHPLELVLELGVVVLPAGEIRSKSGGKVAGQAVLPGEQGTVQIQRNDDESVLLPLPLLGLADLVLDPPAFERLRGAADKQLVVSPDRFVDDVQDPFTGPDVLLVQPAADSFAL